jgi:asparagine synthase (glutamine-hydrolysing)
MRHDLRDRIHDVLLGKTARERGLFAPSYVERLVARLDSLNPPTDRIWTLLILELWFREFIDRPRATLGVSESLSVS